MMRVHARRSSSVLSCTLVVLFFAVSFNAYACLLPVNGVPVATMENACSTADEQPAFQFCDAVKTLGVQSVDKPHFNSDSQSICSEDTASLTSLVKLTSPGNHLSGHPTVSPPQDLLLRISVLRI